MNIFNIYRSFWNYAFENPEKIKPTHIAIFSFAVEHCNRLGWKKKFGLPTSMVMEAIWIKSYASYKKAFDELIDFWLIEIIEFSKNQYSSNIIALKEFDKAPTKALDKALQKHHTKHSQSTASINKQDNKEQINKEQINKEQEVIDYQEEIKKIIDYWNLLLKNKYTITDNLLNEYKRIRDKYSKEDIKKSLWNYFDKAKEETYKQYRLSPHDFFKQKNGFIKFYNQ